MFEIGEAWAGEPQGLYEIAAQSRIDAGCVPSAASAQQLVGGAQNRSLTD